MYNHRVYTGDSQESPGSKRKIRSSRIINDPLRLYENALLKYEKPSPQSRQRLTNARLERHQWQQHQHHLQNNHYHEWSIDEGLTRNKSKSTSSIDTQSVNNILDEFEDLDYRRSSDLSDMDGVDVTNFEEIMDLQKKHRTEKSTTRNAKSHSNIEKVSPAERTNKTVLKVSRQTQVRQRSRDRQRENDRKVPAADENVRHERKTMPSYFEREPRSSFRGTKVPEILRKGEVQRRVDEWLSQTRNQNCIGARDAKGLTRSNSSAEQKSQRKFRYQEMRSRETHMNGSSSYDDISRDDLKFGRSKVDSKVSVGVNTSRGSYKQYLALKNKSKKTQQPDIVIENFQNCQASRELSPITRIPQQRTHSANTSFRSARYTDGPEQELSHRNEDINIAPPVNSGSKIARSRNLMETRIYSLVKARNEAGSTSSAAVGPIAKRSSFKREAVPRVEKGSPLTSPNKARESIRLPQADETAADGFKTIESNAPSCDSNEEIYGPVSARVRAYQGYDEYRAPKSRSQQATTLHVETKIHSATPPKNDEPRLSTNSPQSSFKPVEKILPALNQSTNQQCSSKVAIEEATKYVEKIYESALQPEVIHVDDLQSAIKSAHTNFVYQEKFPNDTISITTFANNNEEARSKNVDHACNYSEIETPSQQCSQTQHNSPTCKPRRMSSFTRQNDRVSFSKHCQKITVDDQNERFGIFQSPSASLNIETPVHDEESYKNGEDLTNSPKVSIAERIDIKTYESRSTLKLNRDNAESIYQENLKPDQDNDTPLIDLSTSLPIVDLTVGDDSNPCISNSDQIIDDRIEVIDVPVVNEFLTRNPPPLPPPRSFIPPKNNLKHESPVIKDLSPLRRPIKFTSVLDDDYISSNRRSHNQENSHFHTAENDAERKKLMDLLRKREFELVKMELERSYTLSTPGGSSPVCCPPCSPPPAPAAYISSTRASSRRLGTGSSFGGGPSSPERDPLGRLLRYVKTFYRELGTRDPPHLPTWASPLPPGTLCPAHFQSHLQLIHKSEQEHRLENIKPDQIFAPVRLSDGSISEAPRRVSVEGGPGSGRTTLCLRLLYQWATQGDGPALVFFVPLRELRGTNLVSYLSRELFPRASAVGDIISQVWKNLHLMEDRVLFVLDGYDECVGGRATLGDAADLLEGRLFPDARILVTCSPNDSQVLSTLVQRRIHLAGLEWAHVERLSVAYFIHNDVAEKACQFLEALNTQPLAVRQLAQHPLGWIMLCALYQDYGSLPMETSALVQCAVKCIVKRSLDPPITYDEEIPGHYRKRLEDFGKMSLSALREGRCCYTDAELRSRGGGIEITRLGFLNKSPTFGQRRKTDLYSPLHLSIAEFLAAYYLTSVAQYANILRRELEGLPSGIIGHLAGLLGSKTHLILNQLCPLEVPPRAMFSLLKAAGASDGNIAAVSRLVGAGPGFGPAPNERPPAPLVHTSPTELDGWARILESPACTLEALEVVFQVERGSDPKCLDDFFEALAGNESVKLVRITSLLGQEFPADEALRLAEHVRSVLRKKRLNEFELVITCLEESAHDRLECVVNALCRGLRQASSHLSRLVLDMNLSGEQVSRVCDALRNCNQVQALHLPHLGCGCEGLASVADLLKERPLLALNLAGSWGAKNEDPSSSGISMGSGSGSGSSGCASSTLGTLPMNRCYSSLPRGVLAAYGNSTRPATLPRLPLGLAPEGGNSGAPSPPNERDRDSSNGSSKRNSDSVLCHRLPTLHPLPTCDLANHQGTGFHEIFNAIREPSCKLRSLNVSKCLIGGLDAACLGETIRRARNLDAVRAAGASRPGDVMPLVLALTEAPCLQLLDLASPRLALDDHPSRLLCHALARNGTLRLLSLEGWTFRIEESDTLAVFSELLRCTSVRELSLCNARLHLAVHEGPLSRLGRRDDAGAELLRAAAPPACPAIVFLRLAGFQVTVNDRLALRGPLLLPFLAGFTALSELDLSLDKSTIGGSSGSLLFIDDKILIQFFSCLSSHFRNLQSLRMNYWRITLEDSDKTLRQMTKHLKNCNLSFVRINGLIVNDSSKKTQAEHSFIQTILTNLQYLSWLCLDGIDMTESQATSVGKCIRDRYQGTNLEISAKDINVKSIKALVSSIEEGGRAEVFYTGGANCRLKIAKIQKNSKNKKK